jgi:hypothetical protein
MAEQEIVITKTYELSLVVGKINKKVIGFTNFIENCISE